MNQDLSIVLKLKDEASQALKGFNGKLDAMKPAFQKMALLGTAAFAGISAGILKTTKDAAIAEGSWNKFNTVFGEGAEDMKEFINDIRKEMPSATHEIARMSADLQDLLVPMGLTRDASQNMTKDMINLANKVAAFNDVDPTEVLEAFKSGLAGSSEPLRRFGINALDSSIELEAMNTGLLKAGQGFKDLDPVVKAQVRAQALVTLAYKQSSDAISGFEDNNDSLIRRQQAMKASMKEMSVTLGNAFIKPMDEIVKKITPVVVKLAEWIDKNPDLARNIIIVTAVVVGLVAIIGTLGLILPSIIAGFGLLATAGGALIGVITAITLPVALIIAGITALIAIGVLLYKNWDAISAYGVTVWTAISNFLITTWDSISSFLQSTFFFITGLFVMMMDFLLPSWQEWLNTIFVVFIRMWEGLKKYFGIVIGAITGTFIDLGKFFKSIWDEITTTFKSAGDSIRANTIEPLMKLINKLADAIARVRDGIASIGGKVTGAVKGFISRTIERGKGAVGIDDGIVQNGKVITTHPDDYLIATKTPQSLLGGAGAGGLTINIDTMVGEDIFAEMLGDRIIQNFKMISKF